MPASTILLLETDDTAGEGIASILVGAGHTVGQVPTVTDLLASVADHHLLIVDVVGEGQTAAEVCAELKGTGTFATIPILCISQSDDIEERIRLLESGADDVVSRPFDRRELEARVEALLLRFQRTKDRGPIIGPEGVIAAKPHRTVVVYSPKGGAGTTTIAVNVALAAAARGVGDIVLIDLDLQFGQVATHLNLEVNQTLVDAVRDEAAMREPEVLRTYGARHDRGVHVLAAPGSPQYAELVTPAHVEAILATALGSWDLVVVDAGSTLNEHSLAALEAADTVILPVYPEIACLKAVHVLLEYLAETGSVGAKTLFVLNNLFAREILKLRDIESALGSKVALQLPYDPFLYLKAVNEGVPVVIGAPTSAPAERLAKLTAIALGVDAPADAPAEQKGRRGLGALLRRT